MPTTGKGYRWPCSVPGCRRTHGADRPMGAGDWALCSKHWPLVPAQMKRALRRAVRRNDKAWRAAYNLSSHDPLSEVHRRAWNALRRLDRRVVRYACDRALGIG